MSVKKFLMGDIIFSAGDLSDTAFQVISGKVRLSYKNVTIKEIGENELFGEMEMIERTPRQCDAIALADVELKITSRKDFALLFEKTPEDVQKLLNALVDKASKTEQKSEQPSQPAKETDTSNTLSSNESDFSGAVDNVTKLLNDRCSQLESQIKKFAGIAGGEDDDAALLTQKLVHDIQYGPISSLLQDDDINDILINKPDEIYVERKGKLEKVDLKFGDENDVLKLADDIVTAVGRRLNRRRPIVDARLPDGSRVNIIAPPLSVDGTAIAIRKFSKKLLTLDVMADQGNVSQQLAEFLKVVAKCRMNVVISGGTGSGKTTLLNAVSRHISDEERIVTIEDAAELQLQQPHFVRLETKPLSAGATREEEVTMRDLVKNALRMRPDRIIVGEVRGPEAFDMMQAMNTGHEGSLTTVHANHPRDALSRLENMIGMANLNIPVTAIRHQIASALHLIIQISRMRDGHRRVVNITEVVGMEGDIITLQELFLFTPEAEDEDGKLIGRFRWTNIMPRFLRRVAYYGEQDRLAEAFGVQVPRVKNI